MCVCVCVCMDIMRHLGMCRRGFFYAVLHVLAFSTRSYTLNEFLLHGRTSAENRFNLMVRNTPGTIYSSEVKGLNCYSNRLLFMFLKTIFIKPEAIILLI